MCKKTPTHVLSKHGEASGTRIVRKSVSPSQCLSRTGLYTNHGPCIDAYGCCGEGELVSGVHTLVAGVVQVYHRFQAVEEEEKGRKVEQEVEREDRSEETARMTMHRLKLEPRCICVCADEDKTTLPEKMRTTLSGCGCWCARCEVPRKHRCCH